MNIRFRAGKVLLSFVAVLLALAPAALAGEDAADKGIEPLASGSYCRYKSPGPGMKFTQGIPLRVLADGIDIGGWQGKTKKMEAAEVRFYVDAALKATVEPAPDGYNYFETVFKDLAAGPHVLALESTNYGGIVRKSWPITITVEAPAEHAHTLSLAEDLVLSGAGDLAWDDTAVKGNGFKVRSAPGWSGSVTIRNSFVTGLGDYNAPGIATATRGGSALIENSVFEGTGALHLGVDGAGAFVIKNNEFRSSNLIKFVSSNPSKSPVFLATGNTTGSKLFQSNRVGAGIVRFERMNGWLIGGSTDKESNILIGPRCVLDLIGCQDIQVRGNYMHHDYCGGWSQGFNLYLENSRNVLAEHNVIRDSSWPIQSFSGELRYNLVVNSGHNWVRTLISGAKMHHNVFVHATNGGDVNSGVWLYNGRKDVAIYNNTFDAGAPFVSSFSAPIIEISTGCSLSSLRNNVFTGIAAARAQRAVASRGASEKDFDVRVAYADYNCFFNPKAPNLPHYAEGLVGTNPPGPHDLSADPKFAKGGVCPYPVGQARVWNRACKVSEVLAYYRERYQPAPGSPLLAAGDPADGKDSCIGAIGAGADSPNDLFGRFGLGK